MELNPEDYKEPRCLSCTDFYEPVDQRNVTPIPVDRVIDKLDAYLSRNDADGARRVRVTTSAGSWLFSMNCSDYTAKAA